MKHTKLIDQHLSGKSASHVVDALMEDLPPLPALGATMQRMLPRDTKVRIEDEVVYLATPSRDSIQEVLNYFELAYPELEFVVEAKKLVNR